MSKTSLLLLMALACCVRLCAMGGVHPAELRGDSLRAQYDYFHAMQCYEEALAAVGRDETLKINNEKLKMKLADCRYLRADYVAKLFEILDWKLIEANYQRVKSLR